MRETSSQDAIGGMSCTSWQHPPRAHRKGRVCREPGCNTILSIYNDSDRCARHDHPVIRIRGVHIA